MRIYTQTLIVVVLIVVHFGGFGVTARNPPDEFCRKLVEIVPTGLPELSKPSRTTLKIRKTTFLESMCLNKNMKIHQNTDPTWSQQPFKIHSKISVFFKPLQKKLFGSFGPFLDAQKSSYWISWVVFGAPLDFIGSPKSTKIRQVAPKCTPQNSTTEILAPTRFQDPP